MLVLYKVVQFSLKAMLRMNIDMIKLRWEVWDMEFLIGSMGLTPQTHPLSVQLLENNTKCINVGRNLSLLNQIKSQDYYLSRISYPSQTCRCHSPALLICG